MIVFTIDDFVIILHLMDLFAKYLMTLKRLLTFHYFNKFNRYLISRFIRIHFQSCGDFHVQIISIKIIVRSIDNSNNIYIVDQFFYR